MKVALVYDRVNKWGGAERVLLALHELFPKAPLYTSVYNPRTAPWARVFRVKPSFLQKIPFSSSFHEILAPVMPLAFRSFSFAKYDLVISVTSEAAKGIIVPQNTIHICYCLTPTRYLWSGYREYFANDIFRFFSFPLIRVLRMWDVHIAGYPNIYIAISNEVKERIKKYYKKNSIVLYPPSDLAKQRFITYPNTLFGYFLAVSRLVSYKRIDIAIRACNQLRLPLIIIGKGMEEQKLKKIAGSTIFFIKNLTDAEIVSYYKNCNALIFPGREDFGLAIVEAQSFGKPVIAFKGGGAVETVIDGKTGILFGSQSVDGLVLALKRFNKMKLRAHTCKKQAEKFNKKQFQRMFKKIVKQYMGVK